MVDTATDTATAPTKKRAVDNFYVDAEGNQASRPQPNVVAIGKKFLGSGYTRTLQLEELSPTVLMQAAAFGMQQVGQNAYGAANDEQERIEMLEERWETILSGRWSSERATGVRTNDVVEAYLAAKADKTGRPTTDEDRAKVKEMLDTEQITTKSLLENPLVAAKHGAIKAARAAERATQLAAAVQQDDDLPIF